MNHCGECKLCCKLLGIEEISKPIDTWCPMVCATGCKVYDIKPPSCSDYQCLWLESQGSDMPFPLEMRPDKSGVIIDATDDDLIQVRTDPDDPQAWMREPMFNVVKILAQEFTILAGVTSATEKKMFRKMADGVVSVKTVKLRLLPSGNMEYHPEDQK